MIRIVTVEREYGSGAAAISCLVAKRLGFRVWDQSLTEETAKRLRCDVRAVEQREEKLDPTYYRLVKTFMRGSYEDRTGMRLETLDAEGLRNLYQQVITDIADRGNCVIIGRGAPWFLRDRPDACHVFLYASRDEKMRRILECGRSRAEAETLLDTVDQDRAAYVRKYHNLTWPLRELYHVMINTKLGDDAAAETILHQIEILNRHGASAPTTAAPGDPQHALSTR